MLGKKSGLSYEKDKEKDTNILERDIIDIDKKTELIKFGRNGKT